MVHTQLITSAVFGIIGNVTSAVMFASSAPTFYRIIKNKSVDEVKSDYYLKTMMSCLFWVLYAMPFIHPGSLLVLTANAIGLVIHLAYLIIFLLYAKDNKQRMFVAGVLLIELALIGLVSGLVIGLVHTSLWRTQVVGIFPFAFTSLMHISRIFLAVKVYCTTKIVENMSFILAFNNTLHDLCWLIYASLGFDITLWVPSFFGLLSGMFELIVYGLCYRSTPILPISVDG